MKYASTALLALLSSATAVKLVYDESEGPTMPDYGESDHHVLEREGDIKNGEKAGGWTNPLGWTDDGEDDESVLAQMNARIRMKYDESEGPTMPDYGESDNHVLEREGDIKNGEKAGGWTNPLGWADDGEDDESVLPQTRAHIRMRYDESEGPTMPDYGESDNHVLEREGDIKNGEKAGGWTNPLGWADNGDDDESVLPQTKASIRMGKHHKSRDAYDHDENTASVYDDMPKHQKFDWGLPPSPAEFEGAQLRKHSRRAAQKKDAYDHDDNTASVYDDMPKHQKFDWGVPNPADFEGAQIHRRAAHHHRRHHH